MCSFPLVHFDVLSVPKARTNVCMPAYYMQQPSLTFYHPECYLQLLTFVKVSCTRLQKQSFKKYCDRDNNSPKKSVSMLGNQCHKPHVFLIHTICYRGETTTVTCGCAAHLQVTEVAKLFPPLVSYPQYNKDKYDTKMNV